MDALAIFNEMAEEISFHQAGALWICEAKVRGHRITGRGSSIFGAAARAVSETHVWAGPCACTRVRHETAPEGTQLRVVHGR